MQNNSVSCPSVYNPYASSSSTSSSMSSLTPTSTSTNRTETVLRNLIREGTTSCLSVRTVRAVQDDLRVNRDGVNWTSELALGLGRVVVNHLVSSALITDYDAHHDIDSNENMNQMNISVPSEVVSTPSLLLSILATAMDRWQDNIVYAVLMEEHSVSTTCGKLKQSISKTITVNNNDNNVRKHSTRSTLLRMLTRLSVTSITTGMSTESWNSNIRQYAINGLATAWRCLDRLQDGTNLIDSIGCSRQSLNVDCSTNPTWWVDEDDARCLGVWSLNALLGSTSSSASKHQNDEFALRRQPSIRDHNDDEKDQTKLASLSITASLLRHGLIDWTSPSGTGQSMVSDRELVGIVSNLIEDVQLLTNPVLPPLSSQYSVAVALMSMSVLSLTQTWMDGRMPTPTTTTPDLMFQRLTQTVQSTSLVENIVHFTFLSSNPTDSSRWILPESNNSSRFQQRYHHTLGIYLSSCWKICGGSTGDVFDSLGSKISHAVEEYWLDLLAHEECTSGVFETRLTSIVWFHTYDRINARRSLVTAMRKTIQDGVDFYDDGITDAICQKLLHKLFGSLRSTSGASYTCRMKIAKLLEVLFADRRSVATNDELSRGLWRNVGDETVLEGLMESVLEHASTEDTNQPLLLCLLDLMATLLECDTCCNHLMGTLGAHNVETIIYLVKPLDVRYDFTQTGMGDNGPSSTDDMNSDTPPLHNLSRLDDASICIEHEEVKEARGFDVCVRLSAATVLARLAYGSSIVVLDEGISILISRISTAVNDFLSDFHNLNANWNDARWVQEHASLDECRRVFRLRYAASVPENESFFVTIMFTSQSVQQQKFKVLADEKTALQKDLAMALERERFAQEDNLRLTKRMKSQSLMVQREISRLKLNTGQEARQLISVHASERSKAENRAQRMQKEADRATIQLQATKEEAQQMKNAIARTENELEQATYKVNDLQMVKEDLQRRIQTEKSTVSELLHEVDAHREKIRSYVARFDEMQNDLEVKEKIVTKTEAANSILHENLEDLFADMVSITQMYQHNENKHALDKKQFDAGVADVTGRLQLERERNDELGKTIHDLQEENQKLYRKLAKYKERLELERKDRLEEDERRRKRNGPVSYFNSLHDSTVSDRSISQNQKQQQQSSRDQFTSHPRKARETQSEKENSSTSNFYSSVSQRRNHY